MHRMRLHGMAAAFSESLQATFAETMTPDSFPELAALQGMGLPGGPKTSNAL